VAPGFDPELKADLERACSDLVYSSESDRPFEFFSVRIPPGGKIDSAEDFRSLLGIDKAVRVEIREVGDFLARHTGTSDPHDAGAQAIRPRYERLQALLEERLSCVRAFRVGKIEIDCYIAGEDGQGRLAGLKTVAIET